jgi:hypothetical protein
MYYVAYVGGDEKGIQKFVLYMYVYLYIFCRYGLYKVDYLLETV